MLLEENDELGRHGGQTDLVSPDPQRLLHHFYRHDLGHDDSSNGGNGTYTTLLYFPSSSGANSAFGCGDGRWRTTQSIGTLTPSGTGQYMWDQIKAGLGGIYGTATTIAVHLQIGSSGATTASSGTVSKLALGYKNAAEPVTYGFGE